MDFDFLVTRRAQISKQAARKIQKNVKEYENIESDELVRSCESAIDAIVDLLENRSYKLLSLFIDNLAMIRPTRGIKSDAMKTAFRVFNELILLELQRSNKGSPEKMKSLESELRNFYEEALKRLNSLYPE